MRSCDLVRLLAVASACALIGSAHAQQAAKDPHIGYIYPAGAQQGSTASVAIGGQLLRGVTNVYVSGEGVHAKFIRYVEPLRPNHYQEVMRRLRQMRDGKQVPLVGIDPNVAKAAGGQIAQFIKGKFAARTTTGSAEGKKSQQEIVNLPQHPLLLSLQALAPRELQFVVAHMMEGGKRRQQNMQIAETAIIEVTVDAGALPGDREIRLATQGGLTNPMRFYVSQFPEFQEHEPNDPEWQDTPVVQIPAVLNGQITAGDIDRFRFHAKSGQKLVIEVQARKLIPYLADAVPGWFQPAMALLNSKGKEVAFADDYRFDPDPVLMFQIPQDDDYSVEIRDALYRGRDDFVYRISVSERPFVTGMYPLGAHEGSPTTAWVSGWNLPSDRVQLDTRPGSGPVRQAGVVRDGIISNPIIYAVNSLPEMFEKEPNDTPGTAQAAALPQIVNGYISTPGDVDVYKVEGHAGDKLVAEVNARRLNSPLDSLLRLTDASGRVLASNDDHEEKETGLLTHHSDSYLTATLPATGTYFVQVSDTEHHGGSVYGYRLRVGAPQPDFALRVTPSSINVPFGRTAQVSVYALRKDGFDGDIDVVLAGAPNGFVVGGGRIPAGRDHVHMTLTATAQISGPVAIAMEGRGHLNGQLITRPVVPAEDMMQAFAYRHLVPSGALMVSMKEAGRRPGGPPVQLASNGPVRLQPGGTTQVRVRALRRPNMTELHLELSDPPKGVTLQDVTPVPEGVAFSLRAAADSKPGPMDNLIVEASVDIAAPSQQQRGAPITSTTTTATAVSKQKRRASIGVLPAIPFQIVQR